MTKRQKCISVNCVLYEKEESMEISLLYIRSYVWYSGRWGLNWVMLLKQ